MSIKAEELRLGNWVSNGDFNYVVDASSLYDAATLEFYPIEGIPLTPEILEKCGFFEKYKSVHSQWNYNGFIINESSDEDDEGLTIQNRIPKFYYEFSYEIKTLHQLQNLYYALTNNELEIKL